MATHTVNHDSFAMRLGQSLGRGVGSLVRVERALWSGISRTGLPSIIVTPVKWAARAAVIGCGAVFAAWGLLYVLAVVAMVAIVVGLITNQATGIGSNDDCSLSDEKQTSIAELQDGVDGFGLYLDGSRVD